MKQDMMNGRQSEQERVKSTGAWWGDRIEGTYSYDERDTRAAEMSYNFLNFIMTGASSLHTLTNERGTTGITTD